MEDPEEKEEKKERLVAQLVHAMSAFCWMLGVLGTFYFFVFTVSNYAPLAQQFMPPPAASPTTHLLSRDASTITRLLSRDAHNALTPPGCTPMLAQHIALHSPDKVCGLLPTPAIGCTPTLALYIALFSPGRVCDLLSNSTHAIDHPTSASRSSQDKLKADISGWNRLVVAFLLAAVFCIAMAKPRVDAAAKAEGRAATKEDNAYETAVNEQSKARADAAQAQENVHMASSHIFPAPVTPDPNVTRLVNIRHDTVIVKGEAEKKVEDLRTLVGVARMGTVERLMVRSLFALSILFSLAEGICSAGAFFNSAELEMGDEMNLPKVIGIIAIPGVPMVTGMPISYM